MWSSSRPIRPGPLTIAHARGAVLGDAAAELLQRFGWRVEREYYVNDAGGQIETLAETVLLRMREAKGEEVGEVPEGWYPGSYLKLVGAALAAREEEVLGPAGEDAAAQKAAAGAFAVEEMMRRVREDLAGLGVEHDVFSSDRAFRESGAVERAVEALKERGHVYAQGRRARGVGAARAAALPGDELRGCLRPALAAQLRGVDIFRRRYRLPLRQASAQRGAPH